MFDRASLVERTARESDPQTIAKQAVLDALSAKDRELAEARATKDGAYAERNQCVALIAKFAWAHGCRVGIAKTAIEGWDEAWHGCVYIDLPTGQVSWHYHDSDAHLFDFLAPYQGEWDGHSTPEKYARVNAAYPIRPTVLETELAEAREEIERLKGLLNANGKPRFNEAMRRLEKAERERDEAMAALREKEEAHLSGLASDIAREIEAHDLFDCPEGTTYVRAAQAIADRLVERFGRAISVPPVSGSREQRGNEEG
ncbi:hypothetical protein SAMN05660750_03294 [Bosea thiooxidans]|uniref:Uncharacterized protein n=1 Tax=Bosea thiooxidans TaxID=53254 RepID=A0A1T5FK70_9HYPH|nr:hypothetical protein [Bosea thiooxidans]SKB96591.1 hypothetical protein SAMN05660750_03294 [Bosea thiooxidans]